MKLTILLLLLSLNAAAQRKTYSYSLNARYQIGYDLEGRVLLKRTEKKWNVREHYIILVRQPNTTMKVIIEDRKVWLLIKDRDYLVLPNCKLIHDGTE